MNKLKNIVLLIAAAALFSFITSSCCRKNHPAGNAQNSNTGQTGTEQQRTQADKTKEGFTKATVVDKTGLDGCSFLISIDSTHTLEPLNLSDEFKKDGLPVWVKYESAEGAVSICMAGKLVNITAIERR